MRITVIDGQDKLLNAYDREIAEYTTKHFQREGIKLVLESKCVRESRAGMRLGAFWLGVGPWLRMRPCTALPRPPRAGW